MIVVDASTLFGAASSKTGVPRRAFERAYFGDVLAMSEPVYQEISNVLHRPRVARFVRADLREALLDMLAYGAAWFDPAPRVSDCRDAKDNKYLELALAAGASILISSDDDLLSMDPWRGVRILRPADYLAHPIEGRKPV